MPCRDYYDDHPEVYYGEQLKNKNEEIKKLKNRISFAESALCGALRAGENNVGERIGNFMDLIDFEDVGVTRDELEKWFKNHKIVDERVRAERARAEASKKAREAATKEKNRKKQIALSKLTIEDKEALGLS